MDKVFYCRLLPVACWSPLSLDAKGFLANSETAGGLIVHQRQPSSCSYPSSYLLSVLGMPCPGVVNGKCFRKSSQSQNQDFNNRFSWVDLIFVLIFILIDRMARSKEKLKFLAGRYSNRYKSSQDFNNGSKHYKDAQIKTNFILW